MTPTQARADELTARIEQREAEIAALRAEIDQLSASARDASINGHHADADEALDQLIARRSTLAIAEHRLEPLRQARHDLAIQIAEQEHRAKLDALTAEIEHHRGELTQLLQIASDHVDYAHDALTAAQQHEQEGRALQGEAHRLRVTLGDVPAGLPTFPGALSGFTDAISRRPLLHDVFLDRPAK